MNFSQVVTFLKAKSVLVVDSWLCFSLQRKPNWWWRLWHYLLLGWKFRAPGESLFKKRHRRFRNL